jgi:hypothetical protein
MKNNNKLTIITIRSSSYTIKYVKIIKENIDDSLIIYYI